jgi:hypothetical protein
MAHLLWIAACKHDQVHGAPASTAAPASMLLLFLQAVRPTWHWAHLQPASQVLTEVAAVASQQVIRVACRGHTQQQQQAGRQAGRA